MFSRLYLLLFLALVFIFIGCTDDSNNDDSKSVASCEGCHTNYAHLKVVASPDTSSGGSSCGGETPHYDPWDRVFMGGEGYTEYKKSSHYKLGCTKCHNGKDGTSDKKLAHGGDFIAHPSTHAEDKCVACHADIVASDKNSIHKGWGQMRKVTMRSGLAGADEFSKLPPNHQAAYKENCAKCHAGCGECHVNRPKAGGGGLQNGHMFTKKPSMIQTCVVCHSSRGGHAYLGIASGTKPDVHQQKGMDCMACHKELHGDGTKYAQRYLVASAPKCETCHTNIAGSNMYHTVHMNSFNCQTCHSQDYNNCGSCHVGGDGARIVSHQNFKIAMNPIPEVKSKYRMSLVRRTLAAPDNWSFYKVPEYANFEAFPTFNYTTPHNILRWTKRTQVAEGAKCSDNCHIREENGVFVNRGLYLFQEDLYDWEVNATKKITVNGKLPTSWGVK
jgi:thiosulfate/3-mercaptopyruvate sulfurtransferase